MGQFRVSSSDVCIHPMALTTPVTFCIVVNQFIQPELTHPLNETTPWHDEPKAIAICFCPEELFVLMLACASGP